MKEEFVTNKEVKKVERFIRKFHDGAHKVLLPEQADEIISFDLQNRNNDYSVMTRRNYITTLRDLALTVKKPFKEMTKEDLGIFINRLNNKHRPLTAQLMKIQTKRFFKFIYNTDQYPEVVRWISTKKSKKYTEPDKKILSLQEKKAMMDACRHQRDRATLAFLDNTGCRSKELANTKIKDIEPDENGQFLTITLGRGKTGRRRIVITEGVSDIQLWLNMHPFKDSPEAPFLISYNRRYKQGPIQPGNINGILMVIAERAGIKRQVHPHLFRHTRAWICKKEKNWNEDQMRVFFGWVKGSKMPSHYGHLSSDDVNEKILEAAGITTKKTSQKNEIKDTTCPRCHQKNPYDAKFCNTCSLALDSKTAEKHIKIIKTSNTIMDKAQEKNLNLKEAIDNHLNEIREQLMKEFNLIENKAMIT